MIIADLQMIDAEHLFSALDARGEGHMEGFVIRSFRLVDLLHAVEIFDLRLGKGRLVFLVPELFDQCLKPLDILLLPVVCGHLFLEAVFLLFRKRGVVSDIPRHRAVFHVIDDIADMIEKHPVMADDHNRPGIFLHIAFQPFDRLKIEMVGRFVEKQNIRFGKQKPHKGDSCLLAAGELTDLLFQIRIGESEAGEYGHHLRLPVVSPGTLEFFLQDRILSQHLVAGIRAHQLFQFLELLLHRKHRRKYGPQFLFRRALLVFEDLLGKIADRRSVHHGNGALIEVHLSGKAPQKSRLAAAVAADNGDFFCSSDFKLYVFKYGIRTEVLAGVADLIQHKRSLLQTDFQNMLGHSLLFRRRRHIAGRNRRAEIFMRMVRDRKFRIFKSNIMRREDIFLPEDERFERVLPHPGEIEADMLAVHLLTQPSIAVRYLHDRALDHDRIDVQCVVRNDLRHHEGDVGEAERKIDPPVCRAVIPDEDIDEETVASVIPGAAVGQQGVDLFDIGSLLADFHARNQDIVSLVGVPALKDILVLFLHDFDKPHEVLFHHEEIRIIIPGDKAAVAHRAKGAAAREEIGNVVFPA